jgi:CheY-like chemotaxis protein
LRRILSVDDEADIREILALALEVVGGFQVALCGSGTEAIEMAPGFAPDLILLDVRMPDMDGPMTLQALRRLPQTAHTPVIFLTAKVGMDDIDRYRRLGALDVIVKPFDPMRIPDQILGAWRRYHEQGI